MSETPTPRMDAAYAVQMSDGHYVGIWQRRENAEAICAKSPGGRGDRVVEMVPAVALTAERAARERAEAELKENEAVINVWRGRTQRAEAERDAAVAWIGCVRDELVTAGFPPGDRDTALASLRKVLAERDALRADAERWRRHMDDLRAYASAIDAARKDRS